MQLLKTHYKTMTCRNSLQALFCCCLSFFFSAPTSAQQGISFERKYKTGEKYLYELTTEYYQNRQWKSRTVSVCELTVRTDSLGIPYESLQWLSQKVITASDTSDESAIALRVDPYLISLHSGGSLLLPAITEPRMTGAITDFNTFYVAIHEKAGMRRLRKPGDQYELPTPVKGNFGNGKTILKGEDCISISSTLKEVKGRQVVIQTNFHPPKQSCLNYYLPAFSKNVSGDTINNIQMIMAAGGGQVNLQFGKESFEVTSHVNIADGMLTEAVMANDLMLRLKVNCNESLQDCQTELPWHIYRSVRLRLLP
jgi:hypothetical protein